MNARNVSRLLGACLTLWSLSGCETAEHGNGFVLGAATDANIAIHAERAPDVPNNTAVNGESGARAAEAVRRLRDSGPMKPAESATTGG